MIANVDILMITHQRPHYTRLALARLLETCDARSSVYLWHNGTDFATFDVVRSMSHHPRVAAFQLCTQNRPQREVLNWFWQRSRAPLLCKVDDDNLMPAGWIQAVRDMHMASPQLGVVACWGFARQDMLKTLPGGKLREMGGAQLLVNPYVPGTGHMMKRACVLSGGLMRDGQSFPRWSLHLANKGWINGWHYPPICMENLDDPRHPQSRLRNDQDVVVNGGVSARRWGVRTVDQLIQRQRRLAIDVQTAPTDPGEHLGLRGKVRAIARLKRQHDFEHGLASLEAMNREMTGDPT